MIKVALFLSGFFFGSALIVIYTSGSFDASGAHGFKVILENLSLSSVITGIACGVLFVFFEKGFIVLYTCAIGAYFLTIGLGLKPILFYAMLILGTIVQLSISRNQQVKNLQFNKQ